MQVPFSSVRQRLTDAEPSAWTPSAVSRRALSGDQSRGRGTTQRFSPPDPLNTSIEVYFRTNGSECRLRCPFTGRRVRAALRETPATSRVCLWRGRPLFLPNQKLFSLDRGDTARWCEEPRTRQRGSATNIFVHVSFTESHHALVRTQRILNHEISSPRRWGFCIENEENRRQRCTQGICGRCVDLHRRTRASAECKLIV